MEEGIPLAETLLHGVGGGFAYTIFFILLYGIWRGTRQPAGRMSGAAASWLRSMAFYGLASILFLAISIYFWKPLPLSFSTGARWVFLVIGSILYFPGLGLLLWGRLVLGKMYFVSTSMGAQLFKGHRLVTRGPFAYIRHPMYTGLVAAALGSLVLYHTWTTLAFAFFAPFVLLRARREEAALAAEFGEEWARYCKRVPAFLPRFRD